MRQISFVKYHGSGNDFIIPINLSKEGLSSSEIEQMCRRHTGIGADGLIILSQAQGMDFQMTYFNADGNQASMCGNGARCAVFHQFLYENLPVESSFLASDGLHHAKINEHTHHTADISISIRPVSHMKNHKGDYILDTGSPHYVSFRSDPETMDVLKEGRSIREDASVSEKGVNVNFAKWKNNQLFVRTYERGVEDETLSCGTGVTAAALAYGMMHGKQSIPVITKGGKLHLDFRFSGQGFDNIVLRGPVVKVFEGNYITS